MAQFTNKKTKWEKTFAEIWTNYVPPTRPSAAEIVLYTKYLRRLQKQKKEKIKLLVLGSTPEFRDWGYQESMDVTVVDYNKDNYKVLGSFMRHRNIEENFVEQDWKDMKFNDAFDIIVGDHAISVLNKNDVPLVVENIAKALHKNGFFITKHYFRFGRMKSLVEIFKNYYDKYPNYNVFIITNNKIVQSQTDKKTDYFYFKKTFNELTRLYKNSGIKKKEYDAYKSCNWANMKFDLYIPTKAKWEKIIKPYFSVHAVEYSEDIYSGEMPIYVLKRNKKI